MSLGFDQIQHQITQACRLQTIEKMNTGHTHERALVADCLFDIWWQVVQPCMQDNDTSQGPDLHIGVSTDTMWHQITGMTSL